MTQCKAMLVLQKVIRKELEEDVPELTVYDTWPENAQYPAGIFTRATGTNEDSIGAGAGGHISNVTTSLEVYTDYQGRQEALILGDKIETSLIQTLTLEEGTAIGEPNVSPVEADIDSQSGYWRLVFEITQLIDNL